MGYWGHELVDNDSTLDFLGDLGDKLAKRLNAEHPSTADFYNAAIVLRGVISACETAGHSTHLIGGFTLAQAFLNNYHKAVKDSKDYPEFLDVLDRERDLIAAAMKGHEARL